MNDSLIREQLCERSETAMTSLVEKYGNYCYSIAFQILRNEEDTKECVNEAYWKIWNTAKNINDNTLKSYIAATVRNTALDMIEKKKTYKRGGTEQCLVYDELSECISLFSDATDEMVIRDTLNTFLKQLPKQERWVFMRRYWNMDSIKDIAKACSKKEDAVRKMLSRTRKKLKQQLEKEGIVI